VDETAGYPAALAQTDATVDDPWPTRQASSGSSAVRVTAIVEGEEDA
jgi:hypothetical protein